MAVNDFAVMTARYEHYQKVWEKPVTDEDIATAIDLFDLYFDPEVYKERYEGQPARIRRYIFMIRIYTFLFYCWIQDVAEDNAYVRNFVDYEALKVELLGIPEFRDVHERNKIYYRRYADHLESLIQDNAESSK